MYKPSDPQKSLFDAAGLLPPHKREECEKSWAGAFRRHALPILRKVEDEFADLFDPEEGRPNRPVPMVVGTLILKEMNDLTDDEALGALRFDVRWWYAFEAEPHEAVLCQKTLHNFRRRLLDHKDKEGKPDPQKKKLAFRRVTDELIQALGVDVGRQRLDSTHIVSNIAIRNRLGLFVDVIRKFLGGVKSADEKAYEGIPQRLRGRYALEARYEDVRKSEGTRRLGVAARDLWRLEGRFEDHPVVSKREEFKLLKRLREEQCEMTLEPEEPKEGDDDHGEGGACVEVKEAGNVESSSLQSAHDSDVTYSGKKGKGYELQVSETCVKTNDVQMITEVEITASCASDQKATLPMVERLQEAGHKPEELVSDTAYSGGENAAALAHRGVNLLAPASPTGKPIPGKQYPAPAAECPQEPEQAMEWLRQQEASPEFKSRYSIRSGIESTNAELKGPHGMKKLRVRGKKRVKLSVYFKALACNVKRALRAWLRREEAAAVPA
ncbi:MAG: transposase [Terriglobia bacterium]